MDMKIKMEIFLGNKIGGFGGRSIGTMIMNYDEVPIKTDKMIQRVKVKSLEKNEKPIPKT